MKPQQYQVLQALQATHWWFVGQRTITRNFLRPASIILDVGSGMGANTTLLEEYGHVINLDISPKAPSHLRADAQALPIKSASINLVTSFDVLYHQWVKEPEVALAEYARVLKPGGHLLMRVPAYSWLYRPHDKEVMTARRFTTSSLKKLLPANMKVKRITYATMFLLPLTYLRKFFRGGDITPLPPFLNSFFALFLTLESYLLHLFSLPCGSSLYLLAKKSKNA